MRKPKSGVVSDSEEQVQRLGIQRRNISKLWKETAHPWKQFQYLLALPDGQVSCAPFLTARIRIQQMATVCSLNIFEHPRR